MELQQKNVSLFIPRSIKPWSNMLGIKYITYFRPGVASVGVWYADRDIWPSGPTDERLKDTGGGIPAFPDGQGT